VAITIFKQPPFWPTAEAEEEEEEEEE